MALDPGSKLGSHEIVGPLGAGGMGEVYRARDTRLGREVAIKVLPSEVARDPERLSRFQREATLLASLNHPHIASIYGLDESDGDPFLVLELVEGEDLAERLKRGPFSVEDTVEIALQMAEALEEAHEKGIVHRDLKPGNVKLTPDGKVKVLDFGLAKAWEPSPGGEPDLTHSPTLSAQMTGAGVILGTAAYMSPEQARGKPVDKRTDLWAFGCIVFEMLAGARPFSGEDVAQILAAVIQSEPDWNALPPSVPVPLRRLIGRCLRKDRRLRLRDIGDARNELLDLGSDAAAGDPGEAPAASGRLVRMAPWALAGVLAAGLGVAMLGPQAGEAPRPVRRFAIDLPWHSVPNWTDFIAAISPTGDHIAYNGRVGNRVDAYLRPLDVLEGHAVTPARESTSFAFSPDGGWLAIQNGSRLSKVPVRGGQPVPLAELLEPGPAGAVGRQPLDAYGLSWGPRGDLLIGTTSGILRVPASGGVAESVTRIDEAAGERVHGDPRHLPDGRRALVTVYLESGPPRLGIVDLDGGALTRLPLQGAAASWVRSGHLVFRQRTTAMAVPFDLDSLETAGDPVPVLEGVRWGPFVADDGTMLYMPVRVEEQARLIWVDRSGHATPASDERRNYTHLDLAGNGRSVVLNVGGDTFEMDLSAGTRQLLASGAIFPVFSADDRQATLYRWSEKIFQQAADGAGGATTLVGRDTPVRAGVDGDRRPLGTLVPTSWNARTGDLAFFDDASDIWILDREGSVRPFLETAANERTGRFSPDGRWLAYVSNETGEYEVYVVAYPDPGRKVPVSIDGGLSPIWSPDGRELFYRKGGRLLVAEVRYEPELSFGPPTELFDGPYTVDLMGHQRWDVAPDGERFLMVENSADYRIVVVENWFEDLERLAPTR